MFIIVARRRIDNPNCAYCGGYLGYRVTDHIERYGKKIYHLDCYKELKQNRLKFNYGVRYKEEE